MDFNRGDTSYLMLNYTINGDPIPQDVQEIELQVRPQGQMLNIKKLLSDGTIQYGTLTYETEPVNEQDDGERTFTGFYCHFSQNDTFILSDGNNEVQLRVMLNDEVCSSAITSLDLGKVLSNKVLEHETA